MSSLSAKLKSARPRLHTIAPLTFSICWGYAVTNVLLGLGMYLFYRPAVPIAVASILPYVAWGAVFLILGIIAIYSLVTNNWTLTRNMQLVGLGVKSVWALALIMRCFEEPGTIVITVVWFLFAYVQFMTYVHFLPKNSNEQWMQ